MSNTANNSSQRFEALQISTSFLIDENNNAMDDADDLTPGSGIFISPSTITGRGAITGFALVSASSQGKLQFTDPNVFGESILLDDLGGVTLTTPVENNILTYNGTAWVNSADATLVDLTVSASAQIGTTTASLLGFFAETPIAQAAINTTPNVFVQGVGIIPANGTATYAGYTICGVVANLQAIGILA